jgi:hypothetical protein
VKSGPSIKPTHAAVKAYYAALAAYAAHQAAHEGATETAFSRLLDDTARPMGWTLIPKQALRVGGRTIIPDGTLRDLYNLPRGSWEAKDTGYDLNVRPLKSLSQGDQRERVTQWHRYFRAGRPTAAEGAVKDR